MKEETGERIKKALEIRCMKQVDLIEKTGIDKGQLSSYISGKYKPRQRNLHLIANALSVDEAWLMGYDVPMERPSLRFNTIPDDTPWNRALTKLQSGNTLTEEEIDALHTGLPKAVEHCKEVLTTFDDEIFNLHLKTSFSQLSCENKKRVIDYANNLLKIQKMEEEQLCMMPNAAHARTDIEIPEGTDTSDDDIMDSDDF